MEKEYMQILNGLTILLVDDSEINIEIETMMLEKYGAKIVAVTNGKNAINEFGNSEPSKFDIIFMDVVMPEMDGYETTRRIRALNHMRASQIPIFAVTTNTGTDDIRRCKGAGMNEHIPKPIDLEYLVKIVSKYKSKLVCSRTF